ncbi:hypothetical protein Aph01nite_22440 [Acrocarpospora phusangensis]|uniref:Uncharacterized protein n=1 Tax=Acrocarpospora phusangensis TaxID=1070424 RepID=A0A919QA05_9ACTN|nr:hypothetical protein [Acrocarpospora phusangensis]GIH23934.1 hypothetical protein Aph01nite_22440 [Acrocarpospora phusangensis]
MAEQVWQLRRGEEIVGDIHVNDNDFPWLSGRFVAHPGYAAVEPLFDQELALIEADGDLDYEAWDAVYERISAQLELITPDGPPAADFLLHISGQHAWFRWSPHPLVPQPPR